MIMLSDNLWIGNSEDMAEPGNLRPGAILCVAHDLRAKRGWPDLEFAQVGLLDGPGNPPGAYAAAILTLNGLLERYSIVLACCHSGGRSLAVALMWFEAVCGPGRGWDGWLEFLEERTYAGLPRPHPAHHIAFDTMDWGAVRSLMRNGK